MATLRNTESDDIHTPDNDSLNASELLPTGVPLHAFGSIENHDGLSLTRQEINRLILEYLVVEGYKDAAEKFSRETGITEPLTEMRISGESLMDRMWIREAVLRRNIADVIEKVNSLWPELFDKNPFIYFQVCNGLCHFLISPMIYICIYSDGLYNFFRHVLKELFHLEMSPADGLPRTDRYLICSVLYSQLRQLQMLELIRNHKLEDALIFAQSYLADPVAKRLSDHPQLLNEMQNTMALLAFDDPAQSIYGCLLGPQHAELVAGALNRAILRHIEASGDDLDGIDEGKTSTAANTIGYSGTSSTVPRLTKMMAMLLHFRELAQLELPSELASL